MYKKKRGLVLLIEKGGLKLNRSSGTMIWKGVKVNEENLFVYYFSISAANKYVFWTIWTHEGRLWWLWYGAWHDGRIQLWIWGYCF